ncbi:Cysteine-rich outer membrane protein [Sedimentisphaera cyanobacteriorum]|uniref:Cysteine-rich outer membrane protein n=1 Tax=Sedimentisphaera cyanobacteriorum TaxID=1940790 RepID=A0A1Q2HNI8_9BACT|nr:DUF11 domain-containing protein [Sedimentisphaera cyanobacteriorum]AQQ08815.1 Cysteine-rich outer membrane protein [Sedimentisphaera cyanobacteriorum]
MSVRKVSSIIAIMSMILLFTGCYSCESYYAMQGKQVQPGSEGKAFWDEDCKVVNEEPVKRAQPSEDEITYKPEPKKKKEVSIVRRLIQVNKTMPKEVVLGKEFSYTLDVINESNQTLSEVIVYEQPSKSFDFISSKPKAQKHDGKYKFMLGQMQPDSSSEIEITGKAADMEAIQNCTTYSYLIPSCSYTRVVNPELIVEQELPAEAIVCDDITVSYTVTNPGSGVAKDVVIRENLPAGMQLKEGGKQVRIDAGDLAAGESKSFNTVLSAKKADTYKITPMAISASNLEASDEDEILLVKPEIEVASKCADKIYLGRNIDYHFTIENTGDGAAKNLVVTDSVPQGCEFLSASNGGTFQDGKVVWNIPQLAAGKKINAMIKVKPSKIGSYTNRVAAKSYCASMNSDNCTTKVLGIPAILLEVIDVTDPIEVGGQETYVITATNQGTAVGTNIKITCKLEDTQSFIRTEGATEAIVSGSTIELQPLAKLAPKNKAQWKVIVKAESAGDVRFSVSMVSDQLDREVIETESTHQYK